MRQHERTKNANLARIEIEIAVSAVIKKYDLTYIELMQALTVTMTGWLKYALRDERHPDDETGKGGDEA